MNLTVRHANEMDRQELIYTLNTYRVSGLIDCDSKLQRKSHKELMTIWDNMMDSYDLYSNY